jgi:hypothetical protein
VLPLDQLDIRAGDSLAEFVERKPDQDEAKARLADRRLDCGADTVFGEEASQADRLLDVLDLAQ